MNDVVAYERMREAATTLIGLLLARTTLGTDASGETLADVAAIRREVFEVDGYDRGAVAKLADRLDRRIAELTGDRG